MTQVTVECEVSPTTSWSTSAWQISWCRVSTPHLTLCLWKTGEDWMMYPRLSSLMYGTSLTTVNAPYCSSQRISETWTEYWLGYLCFFLTFIIGSNTSSHLPRSCPVLASLRSYLNFLSLSHLWQLLSAMRLPGVPDKSATYCELHG